MTLPTLAVRLGIGPQPDAFLLDDATYGELDGVGVLADALAYEWDDVTTGGPTGHGYVREATGIVISRGGTNQRGPYLTTEAGTVQFQLDNRDSRFDPFHEGAQEAGTAFGASTYGTGTYGTTISANPYWVNEQSILRPGLPVSVVATYDGATFPLFTGKVTRWDVTYPENAVDSVVVVTATDGVADLAQAIPAEVPDEQGAGETLADRCERLLDAISWPTELRLFDSSDTTALLSTFLGRPAWEEMQDAADAVNAYLWVDPAGTVRLQSKSQFPRFAEFTVGEGGQVPCSDIKVSNDIAQLYNSISLAREDGNTQTVTDGDSIDKYGRRSFDRSGLPLETDTAVSDACTYILSQYKDHRLRLDGFNIKLHGGSTDEAWRTMLAADVLSRPSASFTTPYGNTITREGLIRGLTLRVRATVWEWDISTMAAPEALGLFLLDDAAFGVLDSSTLAAF